MEKISKKTGLIALLVAITSTLLIYFRPLWLVGSYMVTVACILYVITVIGLYFFVRSLIKKDPFMLFVFIGTLFMVAGPVISFKWFKPAKKVHLTKYGKIVTAIITDKNLTTLRRRGRESTICKLSFKFNTSEGEVVNSWDNVSDSKFHSIGVNDSIMLIYSKQNNAIKELVFDQNEISNYIHLLKND